jgi:hypothetical protein
MDYIKAWYVKYPAAVVVGYVGGIIYPPVAWLPDWLLAGLKVMVGG